MKPYAGEERARPPRQVQDIKIFDGVSYTNTGIIGMEMEVRLMLGWCLGPLTAKQEARRAQSLGETIAAIQYSLVTSYDRILYKIGQIDSVSQRDCASTLERFLMPPIGCKGPTTSYSKGSPANYYLENISASLKRFCPDTEGV